MFRGRKQKEAEAEKPAEDEDAADETDPAADAVRPRLFQCHGRIAEGCRMALSGPHALLALAARDGRIRIYGGEGVQTIN